MRVRLIPIPTRTIQLFVSSGDDALEQRDFLDALVRNGIVPVLIDRGHTVRFDVDRWERTAPHKILPGGSPNDEFVARAKRATLVVCILIDELGPGTREELEAALAQEGVELAVVWCEDREADGDTEVGRWLAAHKGEFLYDRAGRPGTDGPRIALARLVFDAALGVLSDHRQEELLRERR